MEYICPDCFHTYIGQTGSRFEIGLKNRLQPLKFIARTQDFPNIYWEIAMTWAP
jgi:hypothetical protein